MNCGEVRELAPLYLSGEMSGHDRPNFSAHLAACPSCKRDIEQQSLLDDRLVKALRGETPDTARVEAALRGRMARHQSRRRWLSAGAIAAGLLIATYGLVRLTAAPRLYVDAARDHHAEVIERQPRRWRTNEEEIQALTSQNQLALAQAAALAPTGYVLEMAKNCGIDGQRMLHLVFHNGWRRYSLFLRPELSPERKIRVVRQQTEQVAGFQTGRYRVLVVSNGGAAECQELARVAAASL
jgi:anti-sigma factor RsiW